MLDIFLSQACCSSLRKTANDEVTAKAFQGEVKFNVPAKLESSKKRQKPAVIAPKKKSVPKPPGIPPAQTTGSTALPTPTYSPSEMREREARVAALDADRSSETKAAQQRDAARRAQDAKDAETEAARRTELRRSQTAEMDALAKQARADKDERELQMQGEQARLAQEKERQASIVQMAAAKRASSVRSVESDFSYTCAEGLEAALKGFRKSGDGGDCLIVKIDHAQGELQLEQSCKGLRSVAALAELLDETKPRFVLYMHNNNNSNKVAHAQKRMLLPIVLILHLPVHMPTSAKMLYTRSVGAFADACKVNRHLTLNDLDELTAEWIDDQLKA